MKEFKSNLFLILLVMQLLLVVSCKDEPCDAVVCQNNGICVDGECDCPPGFEGDLCESFTRQKILGNFDVTSNCMGDTAETETWAIGASSSAFNEVLIGNFHKPALYVIATITDSNIIEIKEQFIGGPVSYTISGSGTIEGEGQLSVQYTVIRDVPSDTTNCSVDALRQ
jgi:EGF domain-containing protein